METGKMKLALSAGAVALSMALAGCGGSSSGGSVSTPIDRAPGTTQNQQTPEALLMVAEEAVEDAVEAINGLNANSDQSTVEAAREAYDDAVEAIAAAPADEREDLTEDLTEVLADLQTAEAAFSDEETTEIATGRAMGLFNALTDDPQVGETILGASTVVHDPTISRGLSGAASVSINGESGWEAGDAAPSISGWAGTRLNRGEESYVVYTNIEAAKRKAFLTYYRPADGDGDGNPDYGPTAPLKGVAGATINYPRAKANQGETNFGLITFTNANSGLDGIGDAGNERLLDPSKFPQPKAAGEGNNEYEYRAEGKRSLSFDGTFHGASGRWTCTSSDNGGCEVAVSAPNTAQGPIYTGTNTDTWTFQPDGNNAAQIIEEDNDHMRFGWWVETPTNAKSGGEFLYDVHVFHGGTAFPFDSGGESANPRNRMTGKAEYSGSAAGLYAVKAHMDEGTAVLAARGEFTADVLLKVDFKADSDPGDVSGMITKFVREDGVENDWSLTLEKENILNTGPSVGNITANGENTGRWEYDLYGTGKDDADPTGIAGRFNSKIGKDTAVAGGFAATRQ